MTMLSDAFNEGWRVREITDAGNEEVAERIAERFFDRLDRRFMTGNQPFDQGDYDAICKAFRQGETGNYSEINED